MGRCHCWIGTHLALRPALQRGAGPANTACCASQLRPQLALDSEQCTLQTASVSLFEFGLELKPVVRDGKRKTAVLPVSVSLSCFLQNTNHFLTLLNLLVYCQRVPPTTDNKIQTPGGQRLFPSSSHLCLSC